jgi:hypothetical protein
VARFTLGKGESRQHFGYLAVMMELEVFGSGLLLDGYHRFLFSVAANPKPVRSFATAVTVQALCRQSSCWIDNYRRWFLASILWHKPC